MTIISRMEHSELVQEMARIEQLSTQERLALARRRRIQQLKGWAQRERDWLRHRPSNSQRKNNKRNIYFSDNVVLLEAAARNDIDEVRRLLMKGVNPDSTNEDGLTALHQCCIDDNSEMLQLLLEYGANVNAEDSEKWTPLHAAATCGHLRLVRCLIARGAHLLAVNADGNMPYDICEDEATLDYIEGEMARRGVTQELIDSTRAHTEQVMLSDLKELLAAGGDLEQYDHQGATPLHIAAANGYVSVVEFLLDNHVSTDVRDNDDWQPAHAAACWGHLEVLEMLVQNGADLSAKNKHDETPADICEDPEIRERIMQLKFEQETRRREEAEAAARVGRSCGRPVRRSQSNNTRAQSVRRTSIRDKTLTTKKDAVEEARFRLQAQEGYNPDSAIEANKPTSNGDSANGSTIKSELSNGNNNTLLTSPSATSSPTKINASRLQGDNDYNALSLVLSKDRDAPDGKANDSLSNDGGDVTDLPTETSYTTDNNGKINVTVTVTINAGTLADLKKQRAQIRNSSPDINSLPMSPTLSSNAPSEILVTAVNNNNDDNIHISPVSSNNSSVQKFCGNTGEVVGDVKSKRCCIIQ
ncbi:protein phosphatase 1 regulatory subunit 16A [Chrysoperla carnea]|uniref:protein phosphatase 1 regulatory subunit 16A n=1 Tax=Chrysoperla carnea TaxID=189513 RepID=UPI001D06742B|nr:protein phosphatase 1 regulatory subunit 16A [Chrysoperla carnea]XP_044735063.1 protein phosphatase 1 regulatory subunit 16A [Chrysoperla carnea]